MECVSSLCSELNLLNWLPIIKPLCVAGGCRLQDRLQRTFRATKHISDATAHRDLHGQRQTGRVCMLNFAQTPDFQLFNPHLNHWRARLHCQLQKDRHVVDKLQRHVAQVLRKILKQGKGDGSSELIFRTKFLLKPPIPSLSPLHPSLSTLPPLTLPSTLRLATKKTLLASRRLSSASVPAATPLTVNTCSGMLSRSFHICR